MMQLPGSLGAGESQAAPLDAEPLRRCDAIRDRAHAVRRGIVDIAGSPEGTHVGGSLSCADILTVLFCEVLRFRSDDLGWPERDHFILSKGHASAALYAVLAEVGLLDRAELGCYGQSGSRLAGHPMRSVPGVEFPTGSLGHGLSLGVGLALAAKKDARPSRTFVLLGDGELQAGTVWEAAMAASHLRLDNLVAIVDRNGLQITGSTEECVGLEPLAERWTSFGWRTLEIDGHDVEALSRALRADDSQQAARPTVVLASTTKGKGVRFLEGKKASHYATFTPPQHQRALASLEAARRATR